MPGSSEFPERCHKCTKSKNQILHRKCNFCQELEFDETVLCDLNRSVQNPHEFNCHAFQPVLKLTKPSQEMISDISDDFKRRPRRQSFLKLLRSDKIKYQRALFLQKLLQEPDGEYFELQYHFAWNVIERRPVFRSGKDYFDFVYDTFSECSELVGGYATLCWLSPDHVHVYVESDVMHSAEGIVQEMKQYSGKAILSEFNNIKAMLEPGQEIWDEAYFVETIG